MSKVFVEMHSMLSQMPNLFIKCKFDKRGQLSDIDMSPVFSEVVYKLLAYENPPMDGVYALVGLMSSLALRNGSNKKSCRVFFEAITAAVAANNGMSETEYRNDLVNQGFARYKH